MSELAKREFFKWVHKIDPVKLTPFEITFINILIENFDSICSVGTAGGKRAKLISHLIEAKCCKTDTKIIDIASSEKEGERIRKLVQLSAEHFRGFCTKVKFDLEKQYTFFHGPNGSGKSSFCEALEYSLLGIIEEADARNIPLQKYILHAGDQRPIYPILMCQFEDGHIGPSVTNFEAYRFSFLEKNRIDKFSHISATTEKSQNERIAALFGLTEFSTYVNNFTESLDERYIPLTRKIFTEFQSKVEANKVNEKGIKEIEKEKEGIASKIQVAIDGLNNPEVTTLQQGIDYLFAPEKGLIQRLSEKKAKENIATLNARDLWEIRDICVSLQDSIRQIRKLNGELTTNIFGVNLLDLYKTVQAIRSDYCESVCPICLTPLKDVERNPFDYAEEQVLTLSHIEEVKAEIERKSSEASSGFYKLKNKISGKEKLLSYFTLNFDFIVSNNLEKSNFTILTYNISQLEESLNMVISQLKDELSCEEKIKQYNIEANEKNKKAQDKINSYIKIHEHLVDLKTKMNSSDESILKLQNEITKFNEQYEKIKERIEEEKRKIEFNQNMLSAYNSIREQLLRYLNNLPSELSGNLSLKTTEFYNTINQGDADFEQVEYFKLPLTSSDKILVKHKGCNETDALQVLSEGHIRALGLSILLSKAVSESQPFLIFDDIVNAIDDDHRSGVAELLIKHNDFESTQLIITCHGEQFIISLEDKLSNLGSYGRYIFMPADSLAKRGIVIKYQEAKIPLFDAKEKFDAHELADSAFKCRQATECITNKLWSQLAERIQCPISVAMRNPKALPDLSSVVDGLIKATSPKRISGAQEIYDHLSLLKSRYNWLLMNKGTHFDFNKPECSRPEIKQLLEVLNNLDLAVSGMNVSVVLNSK